MPTTDEQPASELACPHCGAELDADQDWCLECGAAARTRVMRPPDWRIPVLAVSAVVVTVLIAVAIVFSQLADDAKRDVRTTPPTTQTAPRTTGADATSSRERRARERRARERRER